MPFIKVKKQHLECVKDFIELLDKYDGYYFIGVTVKENGVDYEFRERAELTDTEVSTVVYQVKGFPNRMGKQKFLVAAKKLVNNA